MTTAEHAEIQRLVGPRPATAAEASPRLQRYWFLVNMTAPRTVGGFPEPVWTPLDAARQAAEDDQAGRLATMKRWCGGQA